MNNNIFLGDWDSAFITVHFKGETYTEAATRVAAQNNLGDAVDEANAVSTPDVDLIDHFEEGEFGDRVMMGFGN